MPKWKKYFGLFIATIPDVACGVLAAHWIFSFDSIFSAPTLQDGALQFFVYVIAGAGALIPDLDHFLVKRPDHIEDLTGEHQSVSHHPLKTEPTLGLIMPLPSRLLAKGPYWNLASPLGLRGHKPLNPMR